MKLSELVEGNLYRMSENEVSTEVFLKKGAVVRVLKIENENHTLRIKVQDTSPDMLDDGIWWTAPEKMEEFE